MNSYKDAKHMAKVLEETLRERNVAVSHGEALNIVARQFGLNDWNTLSARIKNDERSGARRMQALQCWDFIGEHPTEFDFGLDENARNSERRAAVIRYSGTKPTRYPEVKRVFGTLAQTVAAHPYHGQRIEVAADLATERVSNGATIWVRVDGSSGNALAFDNLKDHTGNGWLFGDNDWTRRRIVIDVPPDGVKLFFGFFLKGTGTVWSADFTLTPVGADTSLTGRPFSRPPLNQSWILPDNLDFSRVVSLAL